MKEMLQVGLFPPKILSESSSFQEHHDPKKHKSFFFALECFKVSKRI